MTCKNCSNSMAHPAGLYCKIKKRFFNENETCPQDTSVSFGNNPDPVQTGKFCPEISAILYDPVENDFKLKKFNCPGEACGKYNLCNNIKGE